MPFTTLNPQMTFNLVTELIGIVDNTDYLAQGVDPNTYAITGFLKIECELSNSTFSVYDNLTGGAGPDINIANGTSNIIPIALPRDSEGNILRGNYTLTYRVVAIDGVTDLELTQSFSFNYLIETPIICIDTQVNCSLSSAQSRDITDYIQADATITSLSRAHTLYPPPASGQPNLTANLDTIIYTPVYTTSWQAEVITDITYLQTDGLIVVMQLSGVKNFQVTCDTTLSKALCCLSQINANYESFLCSSPTKAELYAKNVIMPTWRHLVLFLAASFAGNQTKAAAAYDALIKSSGCGGECDCNDDLSIVQAQSNGTSGNNITYVLNSPDNSVAIVTSVVGNITTFSLQVSAALQTLINNFTLVQVAGTSPISVTASGTNPVTYTVTWTGGIVHSNQLVQMQYRLQYLNIGPGWDYMNLSPTVIYSGGVDVDLPANFSSILGTSATNLGTDFAILTFKNFLTSSKAFNATANVMRVHDTYGGVINDLKDLEAEVFWFELGSSIGNLIVRFYNPQTGQPYLLSDLYQLVGTNNIYVSLNINIAP